MKDPILHGALYAADLSPRRGTEAVKVRPVTVPQPILDEIRMKLRTLADL